MRGCALRKVVRNLAHILPPSICLAVFSIKPTLFPSFPPVCVASQYFGTNQRSLVLLFVLVPSTSTQLRYVSGGSRGVGFFQQDAERREAGRERWHVLKFHVKNPTPPGAALHVGGKPSICA